MPERFVAPTPTAIRREATRRSRNLRRQLADDLRRLRLDANVSAAAVGRATGLDDTYIGRIESGHARPSLEALVTLGVALGSELSVRYYAGTGPRLHDRHQALMVEAFLAQLPPRWRVAVEVPVLRPVRGNIDVVLHDAASPTVVAAEFQSDLRRLEQQVRWGHEKALALEAGLADPATPGRLGFAIEGESVRAAQLLVLRSTAHTRELARTFERTLRAAFPARTSEAVAALFGPEPREWPGSAIVWVHLHGSKASILRRPPPGISLGR